MNNESEKKKQDDLPFIDDGIDEYDLYYGENSTEEIQDIKNKLPGPLSHRPSFSSVIPSIAISILFIICTFTLNGRIPADYLWASGDTVFTKHEYWRLFTALFTHADIVHLLSNLPFFLIFGLILYEYFGFILFPVTSLLIGVSANAATLFFYAGDVRLVGASGMIYGMVSLWLVFYVYHDTGHTILMRIFRSTGFTLIVLFPETYNPATSYMAHAAGFLIGIISALLILPFVRIKTRTR